MKNINKKSEFDQQWEDAFRNAEMAPSEGLWDKIDSALSKEEAGYFKKRAFLFKLLAAASIIFALGVGTFSVNYYLGQGDAQSIATKNSDNANTENYSALSGTSGDLPNGNSQELNGAIENNSERNDKSELTKDVLLVDERKSEIFNKEDRLNEVPILTNSDRSSLVNVENGQKAVRQHVFLSTLDNQGIPVTTEEEMMYEIDHIYLIPIMPRGASKKRSDKDYGAILAGLDFSTGLFDPNFQQGNNVFASSGGATFADARVESVNDQLASFNTANKDFLLVRSSGQETKPEIAYSYGANIGFRLSKRIVLQTGLAYRKANTTTTTTGYIENSSNSSQIPIIATYQYQLGGLSRVKRIPKTNLSNQYEFASIPVRAGYVFLDKKINMAVMAGISSEFFLNNEISGGNEGFQSLSTSGNESPYKSVYFNGSLGTMLGYTFAKNYLVTVEPSYRFAVNSFTKNDFYLNSYPSSFMVSFGIAYNFR